MDKSEMMKRYEAETGKKSVRVMTDGIHAVAFDVWHFEYINWLESKAAAYDRLMSGGKKTLKELANILGRAVVVDASGNVESFAGEPSIDLHYGFWYLNEDDEDYEDDRFLIPRDIVDFNGDWKDSLTLPDGWEETKDDKRA